MGANKKGVSARQIANFLKKKGMKVSMFVLDKVLLRLHKQKVVKVAKGRFSLTGKSIPKVKKVKKAKKAKNAKKSKKTKKGKKVAKKAAKKSRKPKRAAKKAKKAVKKARKGKKRVIRKRK